MNDALKFISDCVWGLPTVALIVCTGVYFSVMTGFMQLFSLKEILRFAKKKLLGGSKPFRAISTSLAATVGTGSVTGVATALTLGGAGAVFWLWISAFLGMAVAYAEGIISIKYRDGKKGGIMYAIKNGMHKPWLAAVYAALTVLASFGMGSMAQVNSAAMALKSEFSVPAAACGIAIAAVAAICIYSKKDLTGKLCSVFLPVLAVGYIALMLWLVCANISELPGVLSDIVAGAFGLRQAAAGAAGYAVKQAVSVGFKRGIFSNEAGLGTTAAIHADSGCETAHDQGLMNMLEVIIDTFIICTLTALGILSSGALESGEDGAALVTAAVSSQFGALSGRLVAVSIAGFAAATVIGWSKIGLGAADYLSSRFTSVYKPLFVAACFVGGVLSLEAVWQISDIFNGLMVFPCLSALIYLRREVVGEYHSRPVEPKPRSPRSDGSSSSEHSTSGKMTGVTTS